ncbi:uncharacterized protein LOC116161352 [Photinus pyralis]|uniref:uncharacterized protein LOC116161352 n=1 Tax=Photinus pyralis TaxID=7054 RepID=UPI0012674C38|nr:uncharacterized protein LOC116161352 [Photinus pyralis]
MADKKKPGSFYRKRKADKEKFIERQSGSLFKYIRLINDTETEGQDQGNPDNPQMTGDTEGNIFAETSQVNSEVVGNNSVVDPEIENDSPEESPKEAAVSCVSVRSLDDDPANWPLNLDDSMRTMLVRNKPQQISKFDFPKDCRNRKFSSNHYKRILPNGEEVKRPWLLYSIRADMVICFCCKLFNRKHRTALQESGFKDWKDLAALLSSHEKSNSHLESYQTWKELELRVSTDSTIDKANQLQIKEREKYWCQILERLIALITVLGTQNLALRGTNEKLYSDNNGNFLKFVEFLALFDPVMTEHVRKIRSNEISIHYLAKDIQNELANILAKTIKKSILSAVESAKYYAIVLDCTPDVSHIEQMTMIVRFLYVVEASESNPSGEVNVREHFLGFIPLNQTTGAFMANTLMEELEGMNLSIDNLRGQGYDNGSNMKVQKIYNYFSASSHRWQVLSKHISQLTVKPLSDTRWESRIDALKPPRYQLGDVYVALLEIVDDPNLNNSSGNTSRSEAKDLTDAICNDAIHGISSGMVRHTQRDKRNKQNSARKVD